jgi:uncharacterized protein YjbI with pentapeptide repeats
MKSALKVLLVNTLWFTGCMADAETGAQDLPEAQVATTEQAMISINGIAINGISLNGIAINGSSLNGIAINGIAINGVSLNGIAINGVSLNGIAINGTSLNGIAINGTSINGIAINGTDFIGAHLSAALSNGGSLELRIDDIGPLSGSNSDVLAYTVSASTDDGWTPLCGYDTDGSVKQALAVPGTWNLTTGAWSDTADFSFACRKASVAKCVEFGYKSWLGFADHQHACVRMLRADYCGDGVPHTVNGTLINLYDNAGVVADTESWPVDAEWTPDGAVCLNHHRGGAQPSCYAEKYLATCGTFDNGALLIDEYNGL